MKKEVITVPKDMCPLDVLAELGERTQSAWIYLDHPCVEKLKASANWSQPHLHDRSKGLHWNRTKAYPATTIVVEDRSDKYWLQVKSIEADDIAFEKPALNPEELFFLELQK